jgi:cytochrome c55X
MLKMVLPALCISATSAMAVETGSEKATKLERLVIQDCGSCHGLTLKGGLGNPIDVDTMQHYAREDLRDIILDGIPGTAMPPWRPLISEADALWIADYLKGTSQ